MRQLLQDLRFGGRTLAKTPGFTVVAILVLALGIGANSAMFTLVNAMLLRPLAGKADQLVGLYSHDRTKPESSYRGFVYANYVDIRDGNDVFESLMAHTFAMVGVRNGDATRQSFVEVVSSNFFDALGVPLAAGRAFTAEEESPSARIPVVIVRHDRADLLGKTIEINAMNFTVVGVAPAGFTGTMALLSPDMWLPLGMFDVVVNDIFKNNGAGLANRNTQSLVLAGRLKPGMTLDAAAPRLDAAVSSARAGVSSREQAAAPHRAAPAAARHQHVSLVRRGAGGRGGGADGPVGRRAAHRRRSNIANMLLARGSSRRKEIAIRLAVGGGRARIIRQLLTEGLLLALGGAAGGLLLASWSMAAFGRSLAAIMPLSITFDTKPDLTVMAATSAFAVLATVLSGLGPALKLSKTDLVADLKALTADGSPVLGRRFSGRNIHGGRYRSPCR